MSRRATGTWAIAIIAFVMVCTFAGGAATAFWRATGTGVGAATSATVVAVTLAPGAVAANLYPGGSAAVSTSAANSNAATVRIVTLSLDTTQGVGGFAVTGDSPAGGCAPSSFTFTTQSAGWDLPASGTVAITLTNAVSMATTAANACQGAAVTVYLKAGI